MNPLIFAVAFLFVSYLCWCYFHHTTIAERMVQTVTIAPAPYQGSHDD